MQLHHPTKVMPVFRSGSLSRNDAIGTTDYADGHGLFGGRTSNQNYFPQHRSVPLIEIDAFPLMPLSGSICVIFGELRLN
jgi:hypothetical protein